MKTFKLWLEPDSEIPEFKRLGFAVVDVPVADVLLRGIHPWDGKNDSLQDQVTAMVNNPAMKPAELAPLGYCEDVHGPSIRYSYDERTRFELSLERIRDSIYFVRSLSFQRLLSLAHGRLRECWRHELSKSILLSVHPAFDNLRSFLKVKDPHVKLSGYADLDRYDLGRILKLEDFKGVDKVLIREGLPLTNFRSDRWLEGLIDEHGLLRLTKEIDAFDIVIENEEFSYKPFMRWRCRREGERICFRPDLYREPGVRERAKSFAQCWRLDEGRYCFYTDIPKLARIIEEPGCQIVFPALHYPDMRMPDEAAGQVDHAEMPRCVIGRYLTENDTGDGIRAALRAHGVSMEGRKTDLGEKLARLAARLYQKAEPELDEYFSRHRYIRISSVSGLKGQDFPLLAGHDFRGMLLVMYALRHLRGNVILEAGYRNDTFDVPALARALIRGEVAVSGAFLKVI